MLYTVLHQLQRHLSCSIHTDDPTASILGTICTIMIFKLLFSSCFLIESLNPHISIMINDLEYLHFLLVRFFK